MNAIVTFTPNDPSSGSRLGEEIEADFTRRAIETGLSEQEAKFAYNRNMIDAGGLFHQACRIRSRAQSKMACQ